MIDFKNNKHEPLDFGFISVSQKRLYKLAGTAHIQIGSDKPSGLLGPFKLLFLVFVDHYFLFFIFFQGLNPYLALKLKFIYFISELLSLSTNQFKSIGFN